MSRTEKSRKKRLGDFIARVVRCGASLAGILPDEVCRKLGLRENDEVSFFEVKPGVFVMIRKDKVAEIVRESVGGAVEEAVGKLKEAAPEARGEHEEEMNVLMKLEAIRFEARTPGAVGKALSREEQRTLGRLMEKGWVTLYKGGKYQKEGVYNIPKNIYPLVREMKIKGAREAREEPVEGEKRETASELKGIPFLEKFGYLIVENENEAKNISGALERQIRAGDVLGTRAFDKKFYVARRWFYRDFRDKAESALRGRDMGPYELASALKIKEDGARVLLALMNADGDVIEKKKGKFGIA
ncbi:MAG: hypothetical protein AB1468_01285 [Candidatus Micrarchaeota archaeon]